ncbi:hypothetical protein GCM10008018_13940 [Paenibacillus marchantiophytorum]|uniref:Uncharacterized protein n=1 Tax=Paenibacillus marchantiophytorum TaxID=1619310 RepID=A0ABQ2BTD6_9BACL|nr:hypothetical protein [Paenibacillus marchantiophytorum]GGI45801.1 hypothetical protein GCM10008018_13940 [Paenibacillus marchantiophytorum]
MYPTASGDNRDIQVSRLATLPSVPTTIASSIKIDNIGDAGVSGYYYLSHEEVPQTARSFDTFEFNGKLAYAEKSQSTGLMKTALLKSGKIFKKGGTEIISSPGVIDHIAVDWKGTTLDIAGSNLVAANDPNAVSAIKIYAPGVTTVSLNGSTIPFTVSGNYIYAVRVAIN